MYGVPGRRRGGEKHNIANGRFLVCFDFQVTRTFVKKAPPLSGACQQLMRYQKFQLMPARAVWVVKLASPAAGAAEGKT